MLPLSKLYSQVAPFSMPHTLTLVAVLRPSVLSKPLSSSNKLGATGAVLSKLMALVANGDESKVSNPKPEVAPVKLLPLRTTPFTSNAFPSTACSTPWGSSMEGAVKLNVKVCPSSFTNVAIKSWPLKLTHKMGVPFPPSAKASVVVTTN